MKKILEMRQKRAKLIADARALNDKVEAEERSFTAEEQNSWDAMMDEADQLRADIEREERMMEAENELERSASSGNRPEPGDDPSQREQQDREERDPRDTDEYRAAFRRFMADGVHAMTDSERRAVLAADVDAGGGHMIAPVQFINDLIQNVDDMVYMRQWGSTFQVTTAQALGAPKLVNDPDDADWTSELKTGNEDNALEFGGRQLTPHPLAKRVKISRRLLRLMPNSEDIVRARLSYKFGVSQEKGFLTGNGANQPLGVFTASADGIPVSRDISEDNTASAPTTDGLISAKYFLKPQYWPRARWMMHRDVVKVIAKLKDNDGQYLWRESVRVGEPDRLLGLPVFMNEFCPNALTANAYVGILGDFSHYWIADALDMDFQRLNELYAETNQVGLIGRLETDGMPVLEEAFVRVQLASS